MASKNPETRAAKMRRWTLARSTENLYRNQLLGVVRQVGMIVKGARDLPGPDPLITRVPWIVRALSNYAELIDPWAKSVAKLVLTNVENKDFRMWRANSQTMGRELRQQIAKAPMGDILRKLQAEQVTLIKSIPLQAAERVNLAAMSNLTTGERANTLFKVIMSTEQVSESRARTIARTETSRAASNLVQARSQWAGGDGYIWRTVRDLDVRHSHSQMEGKYVRWAHPPMLDGLVGHAGTLPNCRCFSEPIFPEDD